MLATINPILPIIEIDLAACGILNSRYLSPYPFVYAPQIYVNESPAYVYDENALLRVTVLDIL